MSEPTSERRLSIPLFLCIAALVASYGVRLACQLAAQPDGAFGLGSLVIMLGLAALGTMLARLEPGHALALAAGAVGVIDIVVAGLGAWHGQSLSWTQLSTGLASIATVGAAGWSLRRSRGRRLRG